MSYASCPPGGLLTSTVDTGAAQTAFAIGDLNLGVGTGKVAHALGSAAKPVRWAR